MDLDSELRGLKKFKAEAEEAIAFYHGMKLAGFNPSALQPAAPEDISIGDRVTALETDKTTTQSVLDHIADLLAGLDGRVTAIENRPAAEPVALPDGLTDMLAWFQANKDGLEVLLSLDGDPDEVETPPAAPGDASSASGGATGTVTPLVDEPSPADAPGSVAG